MGAKIESYLCGLIIKTKYNMKEVRFTYQDLDKDNITDLQSWVDKDELWGLIDEEKGGIIGYINLAHIEEITKLLNKF